MSYAPIDYAGADLATAHARLRKARKGWASTFIELQGSDGSLIRCKRCQHCGGLWATEEEGTYVCRACDAKGRN